MAIGTLCYLDPGAAPADSFFLVGCDSIRLDETAEVLTGDSILDLVQPIRIKPYAIGTAFQQ
jgi:hypothetical protein